MTSRLTALTLGALLAITACSDPHRKTGQQIVVIGIDGMDWDYTQEMIAAGNRIRHAQVSNVTGSER